MSVVDKIIEAVYNRTKIKVVRIYDADGYYIADGENHVDGIPGNNPFFVDKNTYKVRVMRPIGEDIIVWQNNKGIIWQRD